MLEIKLLGAFDIKREGKPLTISSRPAQSLFAYLILSAGTAHRREKLAGILWPDSSEESARDYLRHGLWKIRKAIEAAPARGKATPYILANDISISFNAESPYLLDADTLEKLNSEKASADELMETLILYGGELLPGFYDEWVMLERGHLQSVFEQKVDHLLMVLESESRWSEIITWGERWISFGQKPEAAYRALMSAYFALGDKAKVAATFERCSQSLREFGMQPSEQTRALFETLKVGKNSQKPPSALTNAVGKQLPAINNIPVLLTSFIGREKELKEIAELLTSSRLLTLTGSGGVGKTRLAIEAANKLLSTFEGGVGWVDLVGLTDPSLMPQEVAKVLGVPEVPNQTAIEIIVKQLHTKHILLVLDNCEHLISACAQLTNRLLSSCKNLKMLTTSREVLEVPGERTLSVPPLSLPNALGPLPVKTLSKFDGVRLFYERANLVQPAFELNDLNANVVVQICHRLGGIPLAIELAATRVKMMHVDEIAKRLDDRFSLLTTGNRSALPRHQTLRATIDWSYDLLTESERILFRRLSVFVGGFTLKAVEAVCSDGMKQSEILDLFGRLADKSLVIIDVTSSKDESRYRILETIREYAYEKLVEARETGAMHDRHLEYLLNLAEQVEPELEHIQQQFWLDRLELEIDNIRSGLEWALENQEITAALRLVSALRRFWFIRAHHNEGVERLRAILSRPDAKQPTPARLKALNTYFFMLWPVGQGMEAEPLIQASEGMTLAEEVLALGAHLGDRWNIAFSLLFIGVGAMARGDYPLARSYLKQSLEFWQELSDRTYLPWALVYLGDLAMFESDFASAQTLFEQAVPILRQANDYPILAIPLRRLGQLAMYNGDRTNAVQLLEESLVHNWNIRDYRGIGASLAALGDFCMMQAQTNRAAVIFGMVDTLLEFIHTSLLPFDQQQYELNVDRLRDQLDEKTLAKFWAKGKVMSTEEAVTLALEQV